MPANTYKTRSVEMGKFHTYLGKKLAELERCDTGLDNARDRLDKEFRAVMTQWQTLYGYCYPHLITMRHEVPAELESRIDRVEQEELAKIEQEISEITSDLQVKRDRSDKLLDLAQKETEHMRQQNPDIDAREESLKALVVKYQDEYADAYEQIENLKSGAFGWLQNAGPLRAQRRRQKQARREQAVTLQKLRKVRQDWLGQVESTADTQSELREEWQQIGIKLAESETRLEYLSTNTRSLAEQNAVKRILDEMTVPAKAEGELGEQIIAFTAQNILRKQYERGLTAAAEFIGYTRGVAKGIRAFDSSLEKVLAEQKRYSLSRVDLVIQASSQELLDIWHHVYTKLRANRGFSEHPAELARLVEPIIETQLTDARIKNLFESMGQALNRGTAVWG